MPRILIIDDDDAMRQMIADHLSYEYEIIDTGVSENALAMTFEQKPDVILLDLSMPGLSGFELCQVLSSLSITQHIPIFIISGEDEKNRAFCQNLGASKYFTKPVDFAKLKRDLARVLLEPHPERRAEARVKLRVILNLKGIHKNGTSFDVRAATENMSKGGFLCACNSLLEVGMTMEVFLGGACEHCLGHARVVRIVKEISVNPRYGFQFLGTQA